jgi:hypothetical protein
MISDFRLHLPTLYHVRFRAYSKTGIADSKLLWFNRAIFFNSGTDPDVETLLIYQKINNLLSKF